MARFLGKEWFQRRADETIALYLKRIVPAIFVIYLILGIPTLILVTLLKGRFDIGQLIEDGAGALIGMLIGAPVGLLLHDYRKRRNAANVDQKISEQSHAADADDPHC